MSSPAQSRVLAATSRWAGRLSTSSVLMCGYVVLGYPTAMALIGRVAPRAQPPAAEGGELPFLSVVIAAHNEEATIGPKLDALAQTHYPWERVHVIVTDDGSTDRTVEVVRRRAPWAQLVTEAQRNGKAVALNRAMSQVKHPVVVFSDAEAILAPEALNEIVAPLADPRVGAVSGQLQPLPRSGEASSGERIYWRYENAVRRGEARVGSVTGISGCLIAVRRELVPEFPRGLINDDFFLAMQVARAGSRVDFCERAVVTEPGIASLADERIRRRRMNAGRWQSVAQWREFLPVRRPVVMAQVVSHKYLRLLLPFAMVTAAGGTVVQVAGRRISGARPGRPELMLVLQAAGYLAAAAAPHVPQQWGPARSLSQAVRYLVVSSATSAAGLRQVLSGSDQLHLWQRVHKGHTDD